MIQTIRKMEGDTLVIQISGTIEESINLEEIINGPGNTDGGTPAKSMRINCKGISRINSVGVKAWIKYFQALASKGTSMTFEECSISIVEQLNLIPNFLAGGNVTSLFLPFSCAKCGAELMTLYTTEDLKKAGFDVASITCSKCSGTAEFDDIPEEYFSFLKK